MARKILLKESHERNPKTRYRVKKDQETKWQIQLTNKSARFVKIRPTLDIETFDVSQMRLISRITVKNLAGTFARKYEEFKYDKINQRHNRTGIFYKYGNGPKIRENTGGNAGVDAKQAFENSNATHVSTREVHSDNFKDTIKNLLNATNKLSAVTCDEQTLSISPSSNSDLNNYAGNNSHIINKG